MSSWGYHGQRAGDWLGRGGLGDRAEASHLPHPPFVEKGVKHSVFKYSLSDTVCHISRSLALLDLDTWKKVKVEGVEVAPLRVATANLPKPAQLGATVDGYSCVGTEVRGTKNRKRVE